MPVGGQLSWTGVEMNGPDRILVIACGALAREIVALKRLNGWDHLAVRCLPAELHNRPERITAAVRDQIHSNRSRYDHLLVAYGDCGTGGELDRMLESEGVARIPGAHCYEFFAGGPQFAELAAEEPGTFYLTDFLARHFDRLVWAGLGLDRHPELLDSYFGNYSRLLYLSQRHDPRLLDMARRAAGRLQLAFVHRDSGYGDLHDSLRSIAVRAIAIGAA